ncbi:hypothetical protein NPIL_268531, partial [Nephila pilipes]
MASSESSWSLASPTLWTSGREASLIALKQLIVKMTVPSVLSPSLESVKNVFKVLYENFSEVFYEDFSEVFYE